MAKYLDFTGLSTFWDNVKSWLGSHLATINGTSILNGGEDITVSGGSTYDEASSSTAGLMSAEDKAKLDGIAEGADDVSVSATATSGNKVGTITVNGTATTLYSGPVGSSDSGSTVSYDASVTSGTTLGTLTIDGTESSIVAPDASLAYTNGSGSTSISTTNAATYLRLLENSTTKSSLQITGSGTTTVGASNGKLTITSTESNISITGDSNGYITASGHTIDVTDLISTLEKVASKYNAGYYYSSSASNNSPVDPVYWGTTSEGFELDDTTYCYLWYTNDGVTWNMVMKNVNTSTDSNEYYYVCTSERGTYITSDGTSYAIPAGFFTLMLYTNSAKTTTTQWSPVGIDYYCYFGTSKYEANGVTADDINALMTVPSAVSYGYGALVNTVPSNYSEYPYMWRILVSDYEETSGQDYTKWKLYEIMSGHNNSDLTLVIDNCDFGNHGAKPGSKWVVYDGSTVSAVRPSTLSDTNSYSALRGSFDNWADEEWVRLFLMHTLYYFLKENTVFYGSNLGFNFLNSNSSVQINGYGGSVNGRLYNNVAPTEDYDYATPQFYWLSGYLYDDSRYKAEFLFKSVCMGMKNSYYMVDQSLTSATTIATNIESGNCVGPFYDISSFGTSSYAIVTNMETGKRMLFKYTDGVWGGTDLD